TDQGSAGSRAQRRSTHRVSMNDKKSAQLRTLIRAQKWRSTGSERDTASPVLRRILGVGPYLLRPVGVDGVLLLDEGQHVVGRDQLVVLVEQLSVPADLTVGVGDARGDALGGQLDADGVVVGDRGDEAQV